MRGTLGGGTLGTTRKVLYTVPSDRSAAIPWFSVYNAAGGAVVVTVYIRRRGESLPFAKVSLDPSGGSARLLDREEELWLGPGEAIEGLADTASAVSFVIAGSEEDAAP